MSTGAGKHQAGEVMFEAKGLTRIFGRGEDEVRAVDDVSFQMHRGEILTVVGESGSGKSTLARMILRLLPISAGTMVLNGKDVTHLSGQGLRAYWRDVQAVFQDPFSAFNQFFSVRRLLARSGKLLENVDIETRSKEALEQVGMHPNEVLDKYPHELSGGQRQRIMIARALMMEPTLLIADEATSMLDASLRANILNVLVDLRANSDLTVLFITHDIGQACYLSDRVLVMQHGKLVENGATDEVIFNPTHDYTQRLLADVPRLHDVE